MVGTEGIVLAVGLVDYAATAQGEPDLGVEELLDLLVIRPGV
jgi:hypothetical protein